MKGLLSGLGRASASVAGGSSSSSGGSLSSGSSGGGGGGTSTGYSYTSHAVESPHVSINTVKIYYKNEITKANMNSIRVEGIN
jgi:hypothetical protein